MLTGSEAAVIKLTKVVNAFKFVPGYEVKSDVGLHLEYHVYLPMFVSLLIRHN